MATRVIAGVRFVREDDGHYYSEGGRYCLSHQFRDFDRRRSDMQGWALSEIRADRSWVTDIDWDSHLVMLGHRGKRGAYKLVDDLLAQSEDE